MCLESVCSKAIVLLLLIHWLFLLSLVRGCCDCALFWYTLLTGLSFLQSSGRGRNSWLFYFSCLFASAVSCLWFSVSLPHGVLGWAAVCNCGISWSYLFKFGGTLHMIEFFSLSYFIYLIIVIITLTH